MTLMLMRKKTSERLVIPRSPSSSTDFTQNVIKNDEQARRLQSAFYHHDIETLTSGLPGVRIITDPITALRELQNENMRRKQLLGSDSTPARLVLEVVEDDEAEQDSSVAEHGQGKKKKNKKKKDKKTTKAAGQESATSQSGSTSSRSTEEDETVAAETAPQSTRARQDTSALSVAVNSTHAESKAAPEMPGVAADHHNYFSPTCIVPPDTPKTDAGGEEAFDLYRTKGPLVVALPDLPATPPLDAAGSDTETSEHGDLAIHKIASWPGMSSAAGPMPPLITRVASAPSIPGRAADETPLAPSSPTLMAYDDTDSADNSATFVRPDTQSIPVVVLQPAADLPDSDVGSTRHASLSPSGIDPFTVRDDPADSLVQSLSPPTVHPLSDAWSLYFSDTSAAKAPRSVAETGAERYEHGLIELFKADSLESLFGGWKALRRRIATTKKRAIEPIGMPIGPKQHGLGLHVMPDDSNFHFFKAGIRPMWEDPAFAKGGKIMLTGPLVLADYAFFELVVRLIGGDIDEGCPAPEGSGTFVAGVVVSKRKAMQNRVEIWIGSHDGVKPEPAWTKTIFSYVRSALGGDFKYFDFKLFKA